MNEQHTHAQQSSHNYNVRLLVDAGRFYERIYRQIFATLDIQPGSRILDAGCGTGAATLLLAEAVGEAGSVIGVDASAENLQIAQDTLALSTLTNKVSYQIDDITALSFSDADFDLAWCSLVIHHLSDEVAGLRELRRILKPDGRLVLREGLPPLHFLPFDFGLGKPGLEERLQTATSSWFAQNNWEEKLEQAGFKSVTPRSYQLDMLHPNPTEPNLMFLVTSLSHHLEQPQLYAELTPEDRQTLEQLVDPASNYYVLNLPDLHIQTSVEIYTALA